MDTDVIVDDQGTIVLLLPRTTRADEWIALNISEEAQRFGKSVVVEHRYAQDIVDGMVRDGLVLT